MGTSKPTPIPFPVSSFPGENPQESAGRLINCSAEPLGDPQKPTGPTPQKWRRQPGLSQHAVTAQTGYRGGLIVANLSYETWLNEAATVDASGNVILLGSFPGSKKVSIARNQAANPDVLAVDVDNGAYILNTTALASATATVTIAGGAFNSTDTVSLSFLNFGIQGFPVTVVYTLGGAETATTVATGLKNLINANATLAGAGLTALSALGVLTISQQGAIANSTQITSTITGTGSETVAFNPTNGILTGGTGTPGITFTGTPLAYSVGGGPQPNSVCFQDGYFFLTSANGHVAATALNSLSVNGLTYITVQAKSDVVLLRGVAFSGLLLLFTTGSCEVWQDAATPAPAFPYARLVVLEFGLIQSAAIAGWETGFSELLWVAQDYGVYWMTAGSVQPIKVSPPDLDRLIEAQVRAGNLLDAGCYVFAGKKFWHLSSPAWSWEFNLSTKKWNERQSFATMLPQGRWRATGGHPAFNKWLVGDTQSGNLLFIDDQNYTENGAPQLFRIESGPVNDFPNQIRIARADFNFDMGVGIAVGNFQMVITGAVAGTGGVVRLTVNSTAQVSNNDTIQVSGVLGTTEANGVFPGTVIDATHLELQGSVFVHAYGSGGVAVDLTSPPSAIKPVCAISVSHNGGLNWGNPLIRQLGVQGRSKRQRASVKNMGLSGPMGDRWRIDVTDPVYTALLGGTQSSDPREIGA
jgi:hypothetical protein